MSKHMICSYNPTDREGSHSVYEVKRILLKGSMPQYNMHQYFWCRSNPKSPTHTGQSLPDTIILVRANITLIVINPMILIEFHMI